MRSGKLSLAQPYFLDTRATLGLDVFGSQTLTNSNQSYGSTSYGSAVRIDAPVTDTVSAEARYSIVNQSFVARPGAADLRAGHRLHVGLGGGEAGGAQRAGLAFHGRHHLRLLDPRQSRRIPHEGVRLEVKQDLAGLGGDVGLLPHHGDLRIYHDFGDDVVGMARGQGGFIMPYGGQSLPFANGFFGGPQFVRGFAVNGFGPRDLTPGTTADNLGGSRYWATTAELQSPIPWLPPDFALKAAVFSDAGSVWGYRGQTSFPTLSQSLNVADTRARPLLDRRRPDLGLAVRPAARRLRLSDLQDELRRDPAPAFRLRWVLIPCPLAARRTPAPAPSHRGDPRLDAAAGR